MLLASMASSAPSSATPGAGRGGKRDRSASDAGPSVLISLADGTEVDLRDRDVIKGLETDGETKAFTLEQLEQLQAQVAAHIKALRAPGGVPEMH